LSFSLSVLNFLKKILIEIDKAREKMNDSTAKVIICINSIKRKFIHKLIINEHHCFLPHAPEGN
jgi:hypothetical protein